MTCTVSSGALNSTQTKPSTFGAFGLSKTRLVTTSLVLLCDRVACSITGHIKEVGSPYSITERWVLELIPVLGSQPASDVSQTRR